MKIIKITFSAVLGLLIFLPFSAHAQDQTERFDKTYPFDSNGKISVSNINGSITIEAWDRNEIKLEAVKTADSRETLSMVDINIEAKTNSFKVETDYGNWNNDGRNNNWRNGRRVSVEFRLTVPRNAYLDEIETVNGSVTVSNMTNFTKISAVNGGVKAINLRGTANLSTVNGKTEADFDSLQASDKISLDTVNGTVNLTLPSDINATLKASTVNGSIKNDFGLPVKKGKYVGRDLYGKVGSGDVQIRLSAVNGTLSVKRKNDGKNINPATNLLKMNDDGDNVDFDNDISKETAKANREAEQEMRKAEREMRKAERELRNVQPIIESIVTDTVIEATRATTNVVSSIVTDKVSEQLARQREQLVRLRNVNFFGVPNVSQKSESFNVKDKPKIKIVATDCAIVIRGWDKAEVKYVLTEFSTGRIEPGNVKAEQKGSTININISGDEGKAEDYNGMRLEIYVPKKSDLKIETNGEIRVEGVSGEVDLKGGDSSINVRNSDGNLTVNSADGRIRVIGFRGGLVAQSADGDVFLEGDFDKVSAKTVDGNVVLTVPTETGATLTADREIETENIKLTADGNKKWRIGNGNAKFDLSTNDGRLMVRGIK